MRGRSLAAGPQRAFIHTRGVEIMWFQISTKLLSSCIISVSGSYFRNKLLGYWQDGAKKRKNKDPDEELSLKQVHSAHVGRRVLKIRYESRFFDPRKSKSNKISITYGG